MMHTLRLTLICWISLPLAIQAQPEWLDDGLVAHYQFNGDVKDASGNGNDAKGLSVNYVEDRHGVNGMALNFDVPEYVETPLEILPLGNGAFSVSSWFLPSSDGVWNVFGSNASQRGEFHLRIWGDQNKVVFHTSPFGVSEGNFSVECDIPSEQWHHCLVVSDNQTFSVYIDGTRVITGLERKATKKSKLNFGRFRAIGNTYYSGTIDDVRYYSRALSDSEAFELYAFENYKFDPLYSFEIVAGNFSWEEAIIDAEKRGGGLAYMKTTREKEIVTQLLKNIEINRAWLGATDTNLEGNWRWLDGSPVVYSNWSVGQPNDGGSSKIEQDYMSISGSGRRFGLWFDDPPVKTSAIDAYVLQIQEPRPPTIVPRVLSGFVVDSVIVDGGYGYFTTPEFRFVGGNAESEAQGKAVIEDGKIVGVTITDAGSGYQSQPSVLIESPPSKAFLKVEVSKIESKVPELQRPRVAIANPNVVNGFLVSAELVDGGLGYDRPPSIEVIDSSGSGAIGISTIEDGVVTSIQFAKAGIGYSEETIIRIDAPPRNADATPRVTEIELFLQLKFPNNYYIIESSSDLINWELLVEPFFAKEMIYNFKVPVETHMRFFRAIQLP